MRHLLLCLTLALALVLAGCDDSPTSSVADHPDPDPQTLKGFVIDKVPDGELQVRPDLGIQVTFMESGTTYSGATDRRGKFAIENVTETGPVTVTVDVAGETFSKQYTVPESGSAPTLIVRLPENALDAVASSKAVTCQWVPVFVGFSNKDTGTTVGQLRVRTDVFLEVYNIGPYAGYYQLNWSQDDNVIRPPGALSESATLLASQSLFGFVDYPVSWQYTSGGTPLVPADRPDLTVNWSSSQTIAPVCVDGDCNAQQHAFAYYYSKCDPLWAS